MEDGFRSWVVFETMTNCQICSHNKGDHKPNHPDKMQAKYDVNFNLMYHCKFCDCVINQFGNGYYRE